METLDNIRDQFPITKEQFVTQDGVLRSITYLDHGASTHPPQPVLKAYIDFIEHRYANIHRGNHYLSMTSSDMFDEVGGKVLKFVNGDPNTSEVVFTTNTTSSLDLASHLMQMYDGATLISAMEHHSNDLPHRRRGEVIRAETLSDGTLDYNDFEDKLKNNRIKLVAMTGASNVTGYLTDIRSIARLAHRYGAKVLIDAAQLIAHQSVDMMGTGHDDHIDFLAAAGHKFYSPFGAAFLVAPHDVLQQSEPYIPGGGVVKFVTDNDIVWADGAERHLPGTPPIAGVVALGAALDWLSEIGLSTIRKHESELMDYTMKALSTIEGMMILGNIPLENKLGVVSFNLQGIHHDTVSAELNNLFGVATRNGCFCAHPYIARLMNCTDVESVRNKVVAGADEIPGAVRATIGIYNTSQDIDTLIEGLRYLSSNYDKYYSESMLDNNGCGA